MRQFAYLVILLLLTTSGCASSPLVPQWQDPNVQLTWPTPPESPRIRYLRSYAGPADLGDKAKIARLYSWLTGETTVSLPFVSPYGITADGKGRIWVADIGIHGIHFVDLARKRHNYIFSAGKTSLESPVGVAADLRRNRLYVSDSILRKVFTYTLSDSEFLGELLLPEGFGRPAGLATTPEGNVYVVDAVKNCVFVFSPTGETIQKIVSQAPPDHTFNFPSNIAIGQDGKTYISDTMNFRIEIFDPKGNGLGTIGQLSDTPGSFGRPRGIGLDRDGHIYVADAAFNNIQVFDIAGHLLLFFGQSGKAQGQFSLPSGLFIDQENRIYVSDTMNQRISIFQYIEPAEGQ